ncbi:MAG: glycosyltransferase family protein [Lachnospiraceae bacterium]
MDEKKICFIMCSNDELYESEALYYISHLDVPKGYTLDVLCVKEAKSMAAGYNEGMQVSDAKYKIYLHQDVFIVEKLFLHKMLDLFQNPQIGMIGMVGSVKMPENVTMWYGPRVGKIYSSNISGTIIGKCDDFSGDYAVVEAIDGLLMATQYDIKWREDIFDKWDFYDVSQSFEFRRAGYQVVVPNINKPWVLHDDGFSDLKNYEQERQKLKKEYADLLEK